MTALSLSIPVASLHSLADDDDDGLLKGRVSRIQFNRILATENRFSVLE